MNIPLKMNRDFEKAMTTLNERYGEDFEYLNGFHETQLNFSDFIDGFIDKNVADVTIDANANASNKDIRSLLNEKGKSHDKLFAFNKIFYEMKKRYNLKTAREWLETEYNGGFYLHDASTSTYLPYCYAYDLTRLAVLEYLTSGVTSIFDMYLTPDTIAEACLDTGMRCVLVSGLNNFSSSPKQVEEEFLKWNKKNSLISYQLGFHAEYTCSKELLWKVSEMAHHYRTPVYAHISETEKEVEECKARYGMTPPMFLDSLGMFDYGGGGFHCVHVTDQDLDVFRRHRMYVITNPGSNTKLASGIAPIADYVRHKIPVAIGTDGPASNNCLDMFREMFLVTGLSKLLEKDAASMDAMEVLKMATVNGAKAMRLNRADVLAKGKYADLIMIDLHQPNMQPIHNIPKNLVYSGSKSNVCMTMIGGKILYRNGEFNVGEDPERIYAKCEKIVKRLLTE